jgi:hypothetical protein
VCAEQGVAKMPCQNLQMQGIFMGHFFYSAVCYAFALLFGQLIFQFLSINFS